MKYIGSQNECVERDSSAQDTEEYEVNEKIKIDVKHVLGANLA